MLKLGVIGCGCRGIDCFADLTEKRFDSKISALCDTNSVRLNQAAKKLKAKPGLYTSVEVMFANEQLDGVFITTPDYYHEEHGVAALNAGVNILIDKPLASTVAGCQKIIAAAKSHNKVAMMGFNLRHEPTLKRLKEIVDSGQLGRILMIENREFYNGGRTYMARWNRKYDFCGGLWVHKGSHDFDIFQWLLDFPRPVRVSSFANNSVLIPGNYPFEVPKGVTPGPSCHQCKCKNICPDVFEFNTPEWTGDAIKEDNYSRDLCIYDSDKDVHDSGIAIVEYDNGVVPVIWNAL